MEFYELNELPNHMQNLILNFVDLNNGTEGQNKEYYRGGYELLRYAMPNEELADREDNLNEILRSLLSAEDYVDLGRYA